MPNRVAWAGGRCPDPADHGRPGSTGFPDPDGLSAWTSAHCKGGIGYFCVLLVLKITALLNCADAFQGAIHCIYLNFNSKNRYTGRKNRYENGPPVTPLDGVVARCLHSRVRRGKRRNACKGCRPSCQVSWDGLERGTSAATLTFKMARLCLKEWGPHRKNGPLSRGNPLIAPSCFLWEGKERKEGKEWVFLRLL